MKIILGSRSPRRRELMQSLIGAERLETLPPVSENEPGFAGFSTTDAIEQQLQNVVNIKYLDVAEQVRQSDVVILCADTIVVADTNDSARVVLEKPPKDLWRETVRDWFLNYYSGTTHEVWTGFQVGCHNQRHTDIVKTKVTMPQISEQMIDWYITTREPVGKAGGYGIQGHASVFVDAVDGSLTNVIGLPMLQVAQALQAVGVSIHQQT